MKVKVISVLEDNYMYLVIEESTRDAVAVDAAVPKRLLEIIRKEDVVLRAILTTHHHWDHARGNEELAQLLPGLRVFGADERIGALTHRVTHGQELSVSGCRSVGTLGARTPHTGWWWGPHWGGHTVPIGVGAAGPCSTLCALVWVQMWPHSFQAGMEEEPHPNPSLFGVVLEGPTLSWGQQRDDEDLPTVPSTLQEEFLYNPFLRVTEEPVQRFTGRTDPVEVLRALRSERDNFKKPKERPNPQAMLAFDWGLFRPFLEKK
ncbi:HAGHL protein, partial [Chloropsis hardwickii]|nr:HAGHL protein [Chloropsis hardwickii]